MGVETSVRYRYRLRPSRRVKHALVDEWHRCRWVWNQCVQASRAAHVQGQPCGPAMLDKQLTAWRAAHDWLRQGSSVAQQQTVRDFGAARSKAISDIVNRLPLSQRRGLPKFHSAKTTGPSLNYTRRGFQIRNGRLVLAGGITVPVVWSRKLPSQPTSVRVTRDAEGHWWASFVVKEASQPLPASGRAIGIDWGVAQTATTTSDEHDLDHHQFGRTSASELAKAQRTMARRKPRRGQAGSVGYRKAKTRAAKVYRQIADRRRDAAFKWAKGIVRDFDCIAVEDFRPRFLARSTMARKAADARISATKSALVHMAAKHERTLVLVNPTNTTIDCSNCGARAKQRLELSERTYTCHACGHTAPRDKNSAGVMLARAGFVPACADGISPEPPPCGLAA